MSICSDGWLDVQRRPRINIMVVSEGEPMFLKAINYEEETKDKHFIVDMLINTIQETSPQKVVHVITDNGVVCKVAGHIMEAKCRHIFWTPCAVHTLNLALKNICIISSISCCFYFQSFFICCCLRLIINSISSCFFLNCILSFFKRLENHIFK